MENALKIEDYVYDREIEIEWIKFQLTKEKIIDRKKIFQVSENLDSLVEKEKIRCMLWTP